MARIRTIKPEFFRHEGLQDLEAAHPGKYAMMVFAALWGHCDKRGRFRWKPRSLKLDILPFLDFDMTEAMALLAQAGFVRRYEIDGAAYGVIPTFETHQRISGKEAQEPERYPSPPRTAPRSGGEAIEKHPVAQEGKGNGTEGNGETRIASRHAPPLAAPSSSQSQSPSKTSSQQSAARWPADAIVPKDWFEPAERARALATLAPIDLRTEATRFANYWASKSGRDATKLDWRKTWINWVLNARSNANGSPARQSGKSQHPFGVFGACLEKERAGDGAPTLEHQAGEGGCFEDPGAPQRDLRVPARPA